MSKPKQPNGDEATAKAKAICFYLPQFHQVPENDEWWGEGFTEWTLLNKAKPQFSGHQQPIEPATEVGQYNLLQKSVRKRHAHMAREYGIHGFCYYHYWFNGKQLLEKPLQAMLDDGEPNLPFCLCWANEPWTRTWQGQGDSVLQAQEYGDRQDWVNHFEALLPFLRHENAITVDGRPLLLIYRSGQISELAEMVACWRELGIKAGIGELMLLAAIGNFADNRLVHACLDGAVEHHPGCLNSLTHPLIYNKLVIDSVENAWRETERLERFHEVQYPGAFLRWDNTPRCGNEGYVQLQSSAWRQRAYLGQRAAQAENDRQLPEPLVFLTSWNEWSEGTYLEPDSHQGFRQLETVKQVFLHGQRDVFNPYRSASLDQNSEAVGEAVLALSACKLKADTVTCIDVLDDHSAGRVAGVVEARECNFLASAISYDVAANTAALLELPLQAGCDLMIMLDMMPYLDQPSKVLAQLSSCLAANAKLFIGFRNSNFHQALISQMTQGSRQLPPLSDNLPPPLLHSLSEATNLVKAAGFGKVEKFNVYIPSAPQEGNLNDAGNSVSFDGYQFRDLNRAQVLNLYSPRFFLMARRNDDHLS